MNSLIVLVALTAGQCENGACKVNVAIVAPQGHAKGHERVGATLRRLAHARPVRHAEAHIRHGRPSRGAKATVARFKPLKRGARFRLRRGHCR